MFGLGHKFYRDKHASLAAFEPGEKRNNFRRPTTRRDRPHWRVWFNWRLTREQYPEHLANRIKE